MLTRTLACAALVSASAFAASSAAAQTGPALMAAAPAVDTAKACYYEGLAYSLHALVTVDVPFRRESPQATQKRLLRCEDPGNGEPLRWVESTLE